MRFVAVDGGMSDNLRPMLYDAPYEADLADRVGAAGTPCTVVGKHCESGDVLIRETTLPDPRPGDVLVDARHRRLRVRDGQQLQRRPAPAGRVLHQRQRARSSCAARPSRTCYARDV